jgi:hypothetical protein
MHDLIGVVAESVTKVDRVVSAWAIIRDTFLAWGLLVEDHGMSTTSENARREEPRRNLDLTQQYNSDLRQEQPPARS